VGVRRRALGVGRARFGAEPEPLPGSIGSCCGGYLNVCEIPMNKRTQRSRPVFLALAAAVAGGSIACSGAGRPADGVAAGPLGSGAEPSETRPAYTPADVRFMQGMMAHHAQAVEMTALVPDRTESADIRLLARRIAVSQDDEMALMRRWLEDRGEAIPGPHAHHSGEHADMPGMLTPAEMARLRSVRGPEFDRLFLELMIHHHEGALVMVEELFATDGAGQESELYQFAAHVESDQAIEIERMRAILDAR
jgi:uncharacterized protein (DUF305 family)